MPVVQNATWQALPGRTPDVIAAMSRAKAIHERLGGSVSAVQAVYAGPNANRISYLIWHPSAADFGRFGDALGPDPEWQQFVAEVLNSPNPAATLISNSVAVDYAGLDTEMPETPAPGAVLSVAVYQPEPGRDAEVLANVMAWRGIAARLGVTTRTIQAIVAGPATGAVSVALLYPNLAAYSASVESIQGDLEFQTLISRVTGAGSPSPYLGQSIGRFLPI